MKYQISQFFKGNASSPFVGNGAFAKSKNLDVYSQFGIARANFLPIGYSANLEGMPISFASGSNQSFYIYFACDDENVYQFNTETGAIVKMGGGTARGNNCEFFNTYLYSIKRTTLYKCDLSTTTWSDTGHTLTTLGVKDNHFIFFSRNDGKLYVAGTYSAGWGIGSLTAANSWTQKAFSMPLEYKPISITELDIYLIISAKRVMGSVEIDNPETVYFFWDRASSTADRIIIVPEADMVNFIRRGEQIFVTGGKKGNIYRLTESGFQFFAQIPFDYDNKSIRIGVVDDENDGVNSYQSGCWWKDRLLIGVTSLNTLNPAGIYGTRDNTIVHEFTPSHADDGETNDVYIGALLPYSDGNLYYGWKRVVGAVTTYGLDKISEANYRATTCYFESLFYKLADKFVGERGVQRTEVRLSRPLRIGEGIVIKYRKSIGDSWITLGTKTYTSDGALSVLVFPAVMDINDIQIRCELTTGASSTTTPQLLEVNLY